MIVIQYLGMCVRVQMAHILGIITLLFVFFLSLVGDYDVVMYLKQQTNESIAF